MTILIKPYIYNHITHKKTSSLLWTFAYLIINMDFQKIPMWKEESE